MDSVHLKSLLIILSGVVATTTKPKGFFYYIMKYNLLQNKYDKLCDSFINGIINFDLFQTMESYFVRDSFLFTIYLN